MHYFIKTPLDELTTAHLEFLKKELSDLGWARSDAEKMREVQAQKLCEDSASTRPAPQGRTLTNKQEATGKRKK